MTFTSRGLYASSSKVPRRRRRPRVGWLVLGAIVAIVALVLGALIALADVSLDRREKTESFSGVSELILRNDTSGNVELTRTDGDAITVARTLRGSPLAEPVDSLTQKGDELWAEGRCDGPPFFFGYCGVDYVIGVPEGTTVSVESMSGEIDAMSVAGDLKLKTTSGGIEAEGVRGDVTAASASGDIEAEGVEGNIDLQTSSGGIEASGSGDSARAESTSGTVELSDFSAKSVEARSTSGGVEVGGGFETADVSSTSGLVEIDTATPFKRITAESTSGGVDISVPAGTYDISAETGSGGRDIGVGTSPDAAAKINATTTSGSVSVQPED
ncbi:hypothetical protein CDO52_05785 [Nocardiopsis gilva YIM 90087]|uniref:DUF4097 domain-containing protein n=1 Tax=Nocardiopsis gilva YIM 90087 TaxID=1235441 RepID=A0A223S2K7_9ACTN|nr:DUF4097 family beta strand repeat-containing protein [Nocardiopsis gilva]ASU82366.1 hypothetical protein CDO52_05785 [Nocardiopsis gilva YIM 90087]